MAGTYIFSLKLNDMFSGGFKKLNDSLNRAKPALASLNSAFGQFNSKLTSFGAAATASLAAYGIANYAQNAIANAAAIDDQLANVGKTTGLVGKDLENFYQRLSAIDTRTTHQGLLDIATVGGKMGVASSAIFGFTQAVDKLNVALGDEFTGGASQIAETVGMLYNNFSQFQGMSYEKAFMKIGSAMNALADAGIASAPFLSEFANRVSAGNKVLSIENVLAYGAALQETGLSAEIAASGFKSFAGKVAGNMDNVAKFMGTSKAEIMSLLNTDAGQTKFISSFAEKFKGAGFAETQQALKKLGLADQETVAVFQNLAMAMEKPATQAGVFANRLEELMAISKKEVLGTGDSINNEFKRKNETLAAQLEKSQKNVFALSREVGVAIAPLTSIFAELFSSFTEVAIPAVRAFGNFVKTDLYPKLAAMMTPVKQGFEWVNNNWVTVRDAFKGFGIAVGIATTAFVALNLTMLANPVFLVVAGVAALAGAFTYAYTQSEQFRGILFATFEAGKLVFGALYDIAAVQFGGIWEMLKGVGTMLTSVFTLDFEGIKAGFEQAAGGIFDATVGTLGRTVYEGVELGSKLGGAVSNGYNSGVKDFQAAETEKKKGGTLTDMFKLPDLAAADGTPKADNKLLTTTTGDSTGGGGLDSFLASEQGKKQGKKATTSAMNSPNVTTGAGGGGVKNIYITIEKVVDGGINITTQNFKESPMQAKQLLSEALLQAVNDVNNM